MGVADRDRLPNSSFSASSSFQLFVPARGRLNGKYAWCAGNTKNVSAEYLEIHIPYADTICAIATQGTGLKYRDPSLANENESVTEYRVEYSNGRHWKTIEKVRPMTGVVSFLLIVLVLVNLSLLFVFVCIIL